MKTETILKAISALDRACNALRCGDLDVAAQIKLGGECSALGWELQRQLVEDVPTLKVKEAA